LTKNNINLAQDALDAGEAMTEHLAFAQAQMDSENKREQRDLKWRPVGKHLKGIAEFLRKLLGPESKTAGLWGYTVDDSPRAPKERQSKIAMGDKKTIRGIILGTNFINNGMVELHIYKGNKISSTPLIVPPQGSVEMKKGYAQITVVNPSTLSNGKFIATRWQ
jgi:hypothetical protein